MDTPTADAATQRTCQFTRHPGPCTMEGPAWDVIAVGSSGRVLMRDPACYSHGCEEVRRSLMAASMAKVSLVSAGDHAADDEQSRRGSTAGQPLVDLMASLSDGPEAVAEREALLATAKADGWFGVKISRTITAYMESTKGLIDGDTYRIIYAYGDGRVGVVERTHHTR